MKIVQPKAATETVEHMQNAWFAQKQVFFFFTK